MTLDELGQKYLTDKSSAWHGYLETYELFFNKFKDKEFNLLEIGVSNGGSLRTWKDYFSKAQIFGIDIDKNSLKNSEDRISVILGSQNDTKFLEELTSINQFDIIIDDGSHNMSDILTSFEFLWPKLSDGGIYVAEDLHACYLPEKFNKDGARNFMDFLKERIDDVNLNGKCFNEDICADRQKQYNKIKDSFKTNYYERSIEAMHIYSSICFIEKRLLKK